MKKRGLILLLMMALMIPFIVPAQAQDDLTDEQLEHLTYISDAMNKLLGMSSVYIEGFQTLEQDIEAEGQTLLQTVMQDMSGWIAYEDMEAVAMDVTNVQVVESVSAPAAPVEVEMSMDMRFLDETLYVRVYDLVPAEITSFFPADWINFTEDAANYQGFSLLNPEQLTNIGATTGMTNIFNENTVQFIEELQGETLEDGTEVRVFEIQIDAIALMQDETMDSMLSALNFDSLGVDMETLMTQMLSNAVYTTTVWVDSATDLPVQVGTEMNIDAELDIMGVTANLVQTVISSFTYSRFNEEIEITAPDLSDT